MLLESEGTLIMTKCDLLKLLISIIYIVIIHFKGIGNQVAKEVLLPPTIVGIFKVVVYMRNSKLQTHC